MSLAEWQGANEPVSQWCSVPQPTFRMVLVLVQLLGVRLQQNRTWSAKQGAVFIHQTMLEAAVLYVAYDFGSAMEL
jgi:hypothetical protein